MGRRKLSASAASGMMEAGFGLAESVSESVSLENSEEDAVKLDELSLQKLIHQNPFVMLSKAFMMVQKVRVGCDVGIAHLAKHGKTDPDREELGEKTKALEKWISRRLKDRITAHPTYPWWSRINGISHLTMARVIGFIDDFGCFYDVEDALIPNDGKAREPITVTVFDEEENPIGEKQVVWVEGIERFTTASKAKKYAGLAPGEGTGERGKPLSYNKKLKTTLWRLAVYSLLMKKNKYHEFYTMYKEHLLQRLTNRGIKVLPTPKGRFCRVCEMEVEVKKAKYCPECKSELGKKEEPEGIIWQGHFHMMCQRKMISLFVIHLWSVYREALGLPMREPYPAEYLGHQQIIYAWDMVDKSAFVKTSVDK